MAKLRIYLADDHAVVRAGLKALINAQPDMDVSGEAGDGRTACAQIPELQPEVVVMDVSMPGVNGAQATAQLKQACAKVKVLALTVHEDKGYLRLLLVPHPLLIFGYRRFSFVRASSILNCQSTPRCLAFVLSAQMPISDCSNGNSPMRRSLRH